MEDGKTLDDNESAVAVCEEWGVMKENCQFAIRDGESLSRLSCDFNLWGESGRQQGPCHMRRIT